MLSSILAAYPEMVLGVSEQRSGGTGRALWSLGDACREQRVLPETGRPRSLG